MKEIKKVEDQSFGSSGEIPPEVLGEAFEYFRRRYRIKFQSESAQSLFASHSEKESQEKPA